MTGFEPNMTVEIEYDGSMAESYPAQIVTCYKIKIIGDDA
ncbi:YobA family protein [Pseudogracilibacillus auburnensis]|nr:YobA family protein [Pseudogracilibacillus auburnensis]